MAEHLSVAVEDRPGELVSMGEATRVGVRAGRWVDDFQMARAAVRSERRGSRMLA